LLSDQVVSSKFNLNFELLFISDQNMQNDLIAFFSLDCMSKLVNIKQCVFVCHRVYSSTAILRLGRSVSYQSTEKF